jgi:hypothetical protein
LNMALLATMCWVCYLWTQGHADAIPWHMFCNLLSRNYSVHSRPLSFVGLCIAVLLIYRRIIVATLMHHGVGSSLIHCRACMGIQSNTQKVTSVHLSHSVATYLLYDTECTLTVPCKIFRTEFCPHILIIPGKDNVYADEELNNKKTQSQVTYLLQKV